MSGHRFEVHSRVICSALRRGCPTIAGRWEKFHGKRDREKSGSAQRRAGVPWTRVPFKALTDYLEGGESLGEFLVQYPSVTREAAIAALEEARDSLMAHLG
jgi:hypothetical protein